MSIILIEIKYIKKKNVFYKLETKKIIILLILIFKEIILLVLNLYVI
jgi:hypothetical protein